MVLMPIHMEDLLACPYCHGDLEIKGDAFCKNCKKLFRKKGNFIDFRVEDFLKGGNALQMRLYNAYMQPSMIGWNLSLPRL